MKFLILILFITGLFACNGEAKTIEAKKSETTLPKKSSYNSVAYFASGCFWCVEAIFESVRGVSKAESGYCGGVEKYPTYELICTGKTRYAETVKVYYDNNVISYETLLQVFFDSHNPETLNQQGPDIGPQYRSAIFYQNEQEKIAIEKYVSKLRQENVFKLITTQVTPLEVFYLAEEYHQDYEKNHPNNPYVKSVSIPRINAFKAKHPELLK